MTRKKHIYMLLTASLFLLVNNCFANGFTIDNQTEKFIAYKVVPLTERGDTWCTGHVMVPRLLVSPKSIENFSLAFMQQVFLFNKDNFAYIHTTQDCTDNPIGYVQSNFKSGMVVAKGIDPAYTITSGPFYLKIQANKH